MDYKKKYEEALEKLQEALASENGCKISGLTRDCIENIFPELIELEDEKIRKALVGIVECNERSGYTLLNNVSTSSMLAWLEKQGKQKVTLCDKCRREHPSHSCQDITALGRCAVEYEQKSTNKVEPKFHEGDWICTAIRLLNISSIENGMYYFDEGDEMSIEFVDKYYHLWTIEDAKEGDVLNANGAPFIYKKHDKNYVYFYCGINLADEFIIDNWDNNRPWNNNSRVYPATKEQRDLLFSKMREAGYEWDAENKILKKIESNSDLTEDDRTILEGIICEIEANKNSAPSYDLPTYDRFLNWLETLKKKIINY